MRDSFKRYDEGWEEFCLRSKRLIYIGIARGWVFPELAKTRKKYGTYRTKTNKENSQRRDLLQQPEKRQKPEV